MEDGELTSVKIQFSIIWTIDLSILVCTSLKVSQWFDGDFKLHQLYSTLQSILPQSESSESSANQWEIFGDQFWHSWWTVQLIPLSNKLCRSLSCTSTISGTIGLSDPTIWDHIHYSSPDIIYTTKKYFKIIHQNIIDYRII